MTIPEKTNDPVDWMNHFSSGRRLDEPVDKFKDRALARACEYIAELRRALLPLLRTPESIDFGFRPEDVRRWRNQFRHRAMPSSGIGDEHSRACWLLTVINDAEQTWNRQHHLEEQLAKLAAENKKLRTGIDECIDLTESGDIDLGLMALYDAKRETP